MYGKNTISSGIIDTSQISRVFDGKPLPGLSATAAGCYIGIELATGYVGVLNELNFFLDYFNTNRIVNNLKFEASTDKFVSDIVEILVVGEEAHEGWNYYDLTDLGVDENDEPIPIPSYPYYRLSSGVDNGCDDLGEIRFIGHEVLDDSNDIYTCEVELVQIQEDGSEVVQDLGTTVEYGTASTPSITEISPRYGPVEGNE